MGIVRFKTNERIALGVRFGNEVVDLRHVQPDLPTDVAELLRAGGSALVDELLTQAATVAQRLPLDQLQLLPPAMAVGKTICLGLNYRAHAAEGDFQAPDYPLVFFRGASSFIGHQQALVVPRISSSLDWEAEVVAFIGKSARHVSEEDALDYVAGYACFNDASVRDYQRKSSQWTVGKNFDGTGAFGPEYVPASELPPGAAGLRIECRLNGQVMQSANTSDMIFSVASTIHLMSQCMTLEPGDLILMGTPAGVGVARNPPVFMKAGDVCEVEIERIGLLRNPVVDE